MRYHVYASSFADPADIARFKRCKERGGTDEECFKLGDNGLGFGVYSTAPGSGPCCALPPETMEDIWGSVEAAKLEKVLVEYGEWSVVCVIKDRMPHIKNIKNGARIDLNSDACAALHLEPPVMQLVCVTPLHVA